MEEQRKSHVKLSRGSAKKQRVQAASDGGVIQIKEIITLHVIPNRPRMPKIYTQYTYID